MDYYKNVFKGRVAIVTGAGRGIGKAIALIFAKAGAKVVVNDIGSNSHGAGSSKFEADIVTDNIVKTGGIAIANYSNIGTLEGVNQIIQTAMDNYGRIDILINNAGIN